MSYHVYAIGNALVDYEFKVSNDFLKEISVDKGLMTLIDEEKEKSFRNVLSKHESKKASGGSAANTVIALAQLGAKTFYSCKVANDEAGNFYMQDLEKEGVKSNLAGEREEGITGKCLVFVTPDADRSMNTFLGITADFGVAELREDELIKAQYLYIEGYLVASPTGREAAIKARKMAQEKNIKVALTFSDPNMTTHFRAQMKEIIGDKIDLIFCNEEEAKTFVQVETLDEAIQQLSKYTKQFVITLGPRGAIAFDGEKIVEVAGRDVKAVDSNGAGDLFAGGFLYALTNHDLNFEKALHLANNLSAKIVTHFGPRLSKDEVVNIKNDYFKQ